jgi:outer membrane protein assembly factor BamB
MKRFLTAVGAVALVAALGGPLNTGAQTTASWPTFHGNAQRNGASTVSGPSELKHLNIWSVPAFTFTSPAVGPDGMGYVGDSNGSLYAFSRTVGNPKWSFKTGAKILDTATVSNDGTRVFVGSDDGFVYGIHAADGALIWKTDLGGPVDGSPVPSADGNTIYVSNINGTVKALATSDGSVKWSGSVPAPIRGNMALSPDGATLFVALTSQQVLGIPSSGPQGGTATTYYLDGQPVSSPAVDSNDNLYITTTNGSVLAFSPGSPSPRWAYNIPGQVPSLTTPAISNGTVYFGAGTGNLYAVSASTGVQMWQDHTGSAIESSPAVSANGFIYVGSDDGNFYIFDSTGKQVASLNVGGFVSGSPALSSDGSVWAVNQVGAVLRLGTIAPPSTLPPVPTPGTPAPTATATTAAATATATSTPSPTAGPLSVSAKASVKPGKSQVVAVHATPNTVVHVRVTYPNGDHQSHPVTTDAAGAGSYSYTQGASKITHTHNTATIKVTVGSGASATTAQTTYKIGFAAIDLSLEPRVVKRGSAINIYIHQKPGTRVVASVLYPGGRVDQRFGRPGVHGWAHIRYTVPKGAVAAGKTVVVLAKVYRGSASTRSTLTTK